MDVRFIGWENQITSIGGVVLRFKITMTSA
jgi:hypothetical protein